MDGLFNFYSAKKEINIMLKNYIFDFGKVLVRLNHEKLAEMYIEDENYRKAVCDAVFDRLYWDRLDLGTVTDEEVREGFCSRLPKELHKGACAVYDNCIYHQNPIVEMKQLLKDIKRQGGRLFLLSNISCGFAENYHKNPQLKNLFSQFDGLVFSGPLGIAKPDVRIFEYLLNKFNLEANESIFIDDLLVNVEGAQKVGIKGYVFDGDAKKLRKELNIADF